MPHLLTMMLHHHISLLVHRYAQLFQLMYCKQNTKRTAHIRQAYCMCAVLLLGTVQKDTPLNQSAFLTISGAGIFCKIYFTLNSHTRNYRIRLYRVFISATTCPSSTGDCVCVSTTSPFSSTRSISAPSCANFPVKFT